MREFSITFKDTSKITGKAIRVFYNEVEVTHKSIDEITRYFINRLGHITIQTENYKVSFELGTVKGFTI